MSLKKLPANSIQMNDQWQALALKYAALIADLFELNRKLLTLLAQHTSVDEFEQELADAAHRFGDGAGSHWLRPCRAAEQQ